jgi:hypothetical protein
MNHSSPKPRPFLTLPLILRETIYKMALGLDTAPSFAGQTTHLRQALTLPLINHQVRAETNKLIDEFMNTLVFHNKTYVTLFSRLGDTVCLRVTSLHLVVRYETCGADFYNNPELKVGKVLEALVRGFFKKPGPLRLHRLRQVRIEVVVRPETKAKEKWVCQRKIDKRGLSTILKECLESKKVLLECREGIIEAGV